MCSEGGCGTCVVAVEEIKPSGEKHVFAINSCLVSILSCHGWKIYTVEGIGNPLKGYHEIQKVLADNNGSQCGFCSPGMVMNMYALQQSFRSKTKSQIENSFGGNICRCTGYRPIMKAFYNLVVDIEDIDRVYEKCPNKNKVESYCLKLGKANWLKVYYISDLLEIFRTSKDFDYVLVAGNTAQGVVWRTSFPQTYIDITSVDQLLGHTLSDNSLTLGANVTLTDAIDIFEEAAKKYPSFSYLSRAADHIDLVANVPVRNIGTLAGNLMLKHKHPRFQSDIFLILETIKATLIIVDEIDDEFRKSPSEFLDLDMNKKIIREIVLRGFDPATYQFQTYKIMKRSQNAHATVNAGFLLKLSPEGIVSSANIVYGAINTKFVHASKTEDSLINQNLFDNGTLQKAFASLSLEIVPDNEPAEASPEARKQLAINLFYKFVLSIAPSNKLSPRNQSGGSMLSRPLASGIQEYGTNEAMYPVTQPVVKLEALAQTSGQTQYIVDKPDLPNQLHACFVTAESTPGSIIKSIEKSEAVAVEGVAGFYDFKDIPGVNSITALSFQLPAEEFLCSGTVQYFSQPVAVIVASSHEIAYKASKLVKIDYELPTVKPSLTPKDLLEAKRNDRIIHQGTVVPKKTKKGTKIIEGEFYSGAQYHFHMETHCSYTVPTEDGLEIWASTQWLAHTQFVMSQILNLDAQKIDVTVKRLGGAYGAKIIRSNYVAAATALAAHKLRKPVRMWLPFHTNMSMLGKRHPLYTTYKVEIDDKGVIQNMKSSLYSDYGVGMGGDNINHFLMDCFENGYKFDTWTYDTYIARTDTNPNTYTRAPGTLEGLACIESIMEEIAYTLNLDPLDVKIANLDTKKYPKILQYINDMKKNDKLNERMAEVKAYNKANRWKKKGLAVATMKWTLSLQGSYTTLVSIFYQNGGVAISHGGVEMGQGINTKVAQVCAQKLGIPMELISIKPSITYASPNSFACGGSWTSEAICYSVIVACDRLLKRMDPVKKQNPQAPWDVLVKLAFLANINLSAHGFVYNDKKSIQDYPIFGVCAAEVEVDILTGQKLISRVDIIEDVGESISPLVDIGQVEGAFVMGIGYYLHEQLFFSENGELLNNRTWNYAPPGVKDIPVDFRIRFPTNNPNPVGVLKSKATAEPPMCLSVAVPLAVRNALASAREDADSSKPKWVPFNGPTTLEHTLLNNLNDYTQYTL
ncbi:unnamed protein product [Ceutorhynchus assimilis]|uniref:Uncharacterized protein n=1 Tax=Ceutorhynchus assimilis TaxID=467358 RepID=A0A9N9MVU7_9CUCU|nr:unnamed protein product [Ceutorhynchus assimilis]